MNCKATLKTESKNKESVSKALNVDNVKLSGLEVKTTISDGMVETIIHSESPSTLLSTLDDVIKCQMMAEELL